MNNKDEKPTKEIHPRRRANIFSNLFHWWGIQELYKGYKKTINEENLYDNIEEHDAKILSDKLEKIWEEQTQLSPKPSFNKAIIQFIGWKFFSSGLLALFWQLSLSLLLPILTRSLLVVYTLEQTPKVIKQTCLYIFAIICVLFIRAFLGCNMFLYFQTVGMKVRVACCSLIFRKSLRMGTNTLYKISVGHIINLISNDVRKFEMGFTFCHWLWISPVDFFVSLSFNYIYVGREAIIGIPVIVICFIFQCFVLSSLSNLRQRVAIKTDQRVRLINDVVSGIQIIKMYTWEKPFVELIQTARRLELELLFKAVTFKLILPGLKMIVSRMSLFCLVVTCVLIDKPLTPQAIFSSAVFYEALKTSATTFFPVSISTYAEMKISIQRIEMFLLGDEKPSEGQLPSNWIRILKNNKVGDYFQFQAEQDIKPKVGIQAKNVGFKWLPELAYDNIKNVDFEAKPQDLVAIIGSAGSGKSTLLQLLTKTVDADTGTLHVSGSMSYASQEPWMFSATVKQNIIFNQKFDSGRYNTVVKVCALEHDFAQFPCGDHSLVGERGMMLSGGQKARINLARAIYKNSDIYFLDDPLSAVDLHVANHIFQQCICKLLKDKCVVMVTNQFQYLENMNKIYLLDKGSVVAKGTYDQINEHEIISKLLHLQDQEKSTYTTTENKNLQKKTTTVKSNNVKETQIKTQMDLWTIIKRYSSAGGLWMTVLGICFVSVLLQAIATLFDFFTTFWINLEEEKAQNLTVTTDSIKLFFNTHNNIAIYSSLLFILLLGFAVRCWTFCKFCTDTSKNLHEQMLEKVIHAPMKFLKTTPCGQILNRFSKDLGSIDEMLPRNLLDSFQLILSTIFIGIYICALNVCVIPPTIIFFTLCAVLLRLYLKSCKNMLKISAAKYSPLFSYMEASLRGLTTIKVAEAQNVLEAEFDQHQNAACSAYYITVFCQSTFYFWIDFCCLLYIISTLCSFFFIGSEVFVGNVGVSMMQLFGFVGMIPYCLRCVADLDLYSVSIERMLEYADLPPEVDDGKLTPPEHWPNKGTIQYQQVSLKYSSEDCLVLKRVSFNLNNGEKVGVIGRTGAGKSSLVTALFRLFNFDGCITIDGINIKELALKELRSKISIIPQDPILFLGTLRKNLDPFDQHSDLEIWSAIEEVELKTAIKSFPLGLETEVFEGGNNFSVGQKQLLCLARVILQKSKIIVLDEATSNVDLQTDKVIQKTIRKKFADCIVLTIAHRLDTVMDSDKILIMDDGQVADFGSPANLLENSAHPLLVSLKKKHRKKSQ